MLPQYDKSLCRFHGVLTVLSFAPTPLFRNLPLDPLAGNRHDRL